MLVGLRKAGITLMCYGHRGGPINGSLLLPAHPTPLCTPLGPLVIILQKVRSQAVACSLLSTALPVNQGCMEDTNWSSVHSGTWTLTSSVRTPYGVLPLREQTTLIFVFQWLLLSFCSLFWFGICSFPLHWGFQKLVDFLTFLKCDILGFSISHSDILIGISCSELTPGDHSGIFS